MESNLSLEVPKFQLSADLEAHGAQWPVTANLEVALRHLRHKSVERILWIDAICIDQSNIEERNQQVPLMKAIYSNTEAVRAWLGDPTAGSDDAMAILKELGRGTSLQDIILEDRLIDDGHLQSIMELLRRP
jgi:Heterokaryon incompatibility protein (HET)